MELTAWNQETYMVQQMAPQVDLNRADLYLKEVTRFFHTEECSSRQTNSLEFKMESTCQACLQEC